MAQPGPPEPQDSVLERLYLARASIKHLAREVRNLGVIVARTIETVEATTDTNDSPGGHTNARAEEDQD